MPAVLCAVWTAAEDQEQSRKSEHHEGLSFDGCGRILDWMRAVGSLCAAGAGARLTMVTHPDSSSAALGARPSVVIADRNPVVRAGLQDFLSKDGRYNVEPAVDTGNAFLEISQARPHCVGVVGWTLPDMTALDLLEVIKRRQLGARVIIYANDDSAETLRQAVRAGAWGFISKNEDPTALLETIATVARGRLCLPYIDIERLTSDPIDLLTKREKELLGALAQGWTNLQIGSRFGISGNTVKYHLKNLYDKLGVKNRAMAVALYMSSPSAPPVNGAMASDEDW
ncbi:MAG TPA: response regulator transcription factor [Hyphomicrobiaceae bacterium]|nr:response regulator transcription factor [Hyphomicrobiaceae bacterium]